MGESKNIRVQVSEEVVKLYLVFSDRRRTRKRSGSNLRRWAEKFYDSPEPLQIRAYASSKRVFMNDEGFQYIAKKCLLQIEGEITLDKAKDRLEELLKAIQQKDDVPISSRTVRRWLQAQLEAGGRNVAKRRRLHASLHTNII